MAGLGLQKCRGQALTVLNMQVDEFRCFSTQTTYFQVPCRNCTRIYLFILSAKCCVLFFFQPFL